MDDAEMVREVTACVETAIRRNRWIETILTVILSSLFFVGLAFLIYGLERLDWKLALPGGIAELAIVFPIRGLIALRQENIRLQILPQMLRLARTDTERKIVFKFIEKIILSIAK